MMTEEERILIIDYALKRVSQEEFLARYPVNPRKDSGYVMRILNETFHNRNKDDVECAMILGFKFGFTSESVDVLCRLILEDWHTQHESMASLLQRIKDPRAVDCLFKTATTRFPKNEFRASYLLAEAFVGIGDRREACKFLDRALEINPTFKAALELKQSLLVQ
jgi:tetratricopeptide (TPR) repeat protein